MLVYKNPFNIQMYFPWYDIANGFTQYTNLSPHYREAYQANVVVEMDW